MIRVMTCAEPTRKCSNIKYARDGHRGKSYQPHQHGGFGHRNPDLQRRRVLTVRSPDPDLRCHHHADGNPEHRGVSMKNWY